MRSFIGGISALPEIRDDISAAAGYLWDRGWAERNAGNISVNVTKIIQELPAGMDYHPTVELDIEYPHLKNNIIVVTGTGTRMRDVHKDVYANTCILLIDESGKSYRKVQKFDLPAEPEPTSELPSHLAIHDMLVAENRNERAILHTHPNKLIALTHIKNFCNEEKINNLLWSIQPETCVFIHEGLGFVPYLQTGSNALAEATIKKFKNHRVVLWEKHGCLAIGKSAEEAFDLIDIAEKSTEIFFTVKNAGYKMEGISPKDLTDLRASFGIK
jgi:rhamnulose-1-phosphate aldolase